MSHVSLKDVQVLAPNFKRRLSGVTSTIVQLIPVQNR
ncbi:glycosyltransferase family 1 protein, partial [Agrobacterium sp. S2]|nr:glycosyltransferase family 1 protein [Agrobacterium sp. S2]